MCGISSWFFRTNGFNSTGKKDKNHHKCIISSVWSYSFWNFKRTCWICQRIPKPINRMRTLPRLFVRYSFGKGKICHSALDVSMFMCLLYLSFFLYMGNTVQLSIEIFNWPETTGFRSKNKLFHTFARYDWILKGIHHYNYNVCSSQFVNLTDCLSVYLFIYPSICPFILNSLSNILQLKSIVRLKIYRRKVINMF